MVSQITRYFFYILLVVFLAAKTSTGTNYSKTQCAHKKAVIAQKSRQIIALVAKLHEQRNKLLRVALNIEKPEYNEHTQPRLLAITKAQRGAVVALERFPSLYFIKQFREHMDTYYRTVHHQSAQRSRRDEEEAYAKARRYAQDLATLEAAWAKSRDYDFLHYCMKELTPVEFATLMGVGPKRNANANANSVAVASHCTMHLHDRLLTLFSGGARRFTLYRQIVSQCPEAQRGETLLQDLSEGVPLRGYAAYQMQASASCDVRTKAIFDELIDVSDDDEKEKLLFFTHNSWFLKNIGWLRHVGRGGAEWCLSDY